METKEGKKGGGLGREGKRFSPLPPPLFESATQATVFTAVLHSNIPRTYFYFGNKGSWNIVEIVTYAFGLYLST